MAAAPNNPPSAIPAKYLFDPTAKPSPDEQIFQGLLAKDELAVWIGHEKHRKTTLVLDFAISAALGQDFLGFRFAAPAPLRVVMFDYESKDNSIHRRRNKICEAMRLSTGLLARLAKNLTIVELRHMIHDGLKVPKIDKFYKTTDGKHTFSGEDWWRSAVAEHPADLYIVDPLRCLHGSAESDSAIEETLRLIRGVFRRTTIIPHHTVKSSRNPKENVRLVDNMRLWSEQCRGSGAIKGHADLIVCQEREIQDETEIVCFGGFMKDSADIDPIPLVESAQESFLYVPHTDLPEKLATARDVLVASGVMSWTNRSAMAETLIAGGVKRATAYNRIKQLIQYGVLRERTTGLDAGITFARVGSVPPAQEPAPGAPDPTVSDIDACLKDLEIRSEDPPEAEPDSV
jgi:hypothetical protein